MRRKRQQEYDAIIVGSGAAGGMCAYVLACSGVKVLMLEAGRDYDPVTETPMFQLPKDAPMRGAGTVEKPFGFFLWNITGINLLPILMGLVFFFQQKYMSPPPSPTMTKEQIQQQKIMKVMMVVMFPLMLYSAPSGLTLYIFTSSSFGILESRYIRQHVKEMDLAPKRDRSSKKKPRDPHARAFADAIDRAKKKSQGPEKKFKKRR